MLGKLGQLDRGAPETNGPAIRPSLARDHVHHRGFSCTVRSDNAPELAWVHDQRKPIERAEPVEAYRYVVKHQRASLSHLLRGAVAGSRPGVRATGASVPASPGFPRPGVSGLPAFPSSRVWRGSVATESPAAVVARSRPSGDSAPLRSAWGDAAIGHGGGGRGGLRSAPHEALAESQRRPPECNQPVWQPKRHQHEERAQDEEPSLGRSSREKALAHVDHQGPEDRSHRVPRPPTATQITISIELAGLSSLGLMIPTCGTYNAPATPHRAADNDHTKSL